MKNNEKKHWIGCIIETDVYLELMQLAREDNRNISSLMREMIQQHLDAAAAAKIRRRKVA